MADAKLEFTDINRLDPEAIGNPGQRTFRIVADSRSSSAELWIEKEHLFELAMGIQKLMAQLPEREEGEGEISDEREAPGLTSLSFKIGKLALGHDGASGMFLIDAYDLPDADSEAATVRLWATRAQLEDFAEEALRVCAAGRPICPLCSAPINPDGHICPRANGHAKIPETDL